MKKRNIAFASLVLLATLTFASTASAFWGGDRGGMTDEDRTVRQAEMQEKRAEHKEQMDTIFANGDFEAWKSAMTERHGDMAKKLENSNLSDEKKAEILEKMTARQTEMAAKLTVENFAKAQEMHSLMQRVEVLREELGFPGKGKGMRGNHKFGNGNGDGKQRMGKRGERGGRGFGQGGME